MGKLDLDVLDKLNALNLPEIKVSPENEIQITDDEIKDSQDAAIGEVTSMKDFMGEPTEEPGTETEPTTKTEPEMPVSGTEPEPSSEDESVIKALASWGKEEGILDYEDDKFEDSTDWLKERINDKVISEVKKEVDYYKENLPESVKEIINNYEEGVPLDELIYSKSREMEYSSIKPEVLAEDKELQKNLIIEFLSLQGLTEESIKRKVQKYEDSLLLDEEAESALDGLKKYEQKYQAELKELTEKKKVEAKQQYEAQIKEIESLAMSDDEIIPGVKLTKEEKQKVLDAYTKVDSKRETELIKRIKSDPKAWLKITQLMVLYDGNLDKVKTKINTQVTKKVKESVDTYKETPLNTKLDLNKIKRFMEKQKQQRQT